MITYVALLRGINVGGSHRLPMSDLRQLFEGSGCEGVRTYIQSGNVVFRSAERDAGRLSKRIGGAIARRHGFEPRVLVLTRVELERSAAGNPFPAARTDPRNLHLLFLSDAPAKPDLEACETVKSRSERFELKGRVFYLYTPDGFGRSKLAERAERLLGVAATARNWRTVTMLLEMAAKTDASTARPG